MIAKSAEFDVGFLSQKIVSSLTPSSQLAKAKMLFCATLFALFLEQKRPFLSPLLRPPPSVEEGERNPTPHRISPPFSPGGETLDKRATEALFSPLTSRPKSQSCPLPSPPGRFATSLVLGGGRGSHCKSPLPLHSLGHLIRLLAILQWDFGEEEEARSTLAE